MDVRGVGHLITSLDRTLRYGSAHCLADLTVCKSVHRVSALLGPAAARVRCKGRASDANVCIV